MVEQAKLNTNQPNILLIVMDATRASNLSCYGYSRPTTPNLDRLAETSIVYDQAISPAGWSLPSHASLFTGLYASRHGADDQHKYLEPGHLTLAEILSERGYHTRGFCANPYVGPATGLDRGFEWFNGPRSGNRRSFNKQIQRFIRKARNGVAKVRGTQDSGAAHINGQVLDSLQHLGKDGAPFFFFIHYEDTHAPYRLPRQFARFLPKGMRLESALHVNQDPWKYLINPRMMKEEDFETLVGLYDSEINYVDSRIGQLLDQLKSTQVLDRTIVIVTADHGENLGDHSMMAHKYCLYDTLLHVPLIIHYPKGTVAPGRVSRQVQTLDIVPTLLNIVGESDSATYRSLQGYDLLSSSRREFTIGEQSRPDLSKFYTRFPGVDVSRFDRALTMIRNDRFKFIWASDGNHELYEHTADPHEQRNLVQVMPRIAADLHERLEKWRGSFNPAEHESDAPEFEQEVIDRLQALGYLE